MKYILTLFVLGVFGINVNCADAPITISSTSFVVFPADCNANPPMAFGGKLLAEMDRCAGITARRLLYSSPLGVKDAVTVGVDKVKFHKGAEVKDLLVVTGEVMVVGESKIMIHVTVERELKDKKELLVEGDFWFVSYDLQTKKSTPHGVTFEQKK